MNIKTIDNKISFDRAIEKITSYSLQIKEHKEKVLDNNYDQETDFNITTAIKIDAIGSLCILVKEYLDKMDE